MAVSKTDGAACLAQWGNGGIVLRSKGPARTTRHKQVGPPAKSGTRSRGSTRKIEEQRIIVKTRLPIWNVMERAQDEVEAVLRKAAAGSAQPDDALTNARTADDRGNTRRR